MPGDVFGIEVDGAEGSMCVAFRLIVKVGRAGIAALAARGDGQRTYLGPELHDRHKAVAA